MTLFLYIRLFINHHDYIRMMSLCLKHRVISVKRFIKEQSFLLIVFRVIKRLLEIKIKSKYCVHVIFKFKKGE